MLIPDEKPKGPEDQTSSFIFESRQLHDDNGRLVVERTPVWGKPPEDFTRFMAPWTITEQTPIGTIQRGFTVPLPNAKTPVEAFEQMGEAYKKELPNQKAELQKYVQEQIAQAKSRIAVASQLPPGMPPPGKGPLAGPGSPFGPRKKPR